MSLIDQQRAEFEGWENASAGLRPIFPDGQEQHYILDQTLDSLVERNQPARIFVRDGRLVRLCVNERGRPRLEELSIDALRGEVDRCVSFRQKTQKGPPKP